jgi:hypothetical protein
MPLLAITGAKDGLLDARGTSRRLRRLVPQATVILLSEADRYQALGRHDAARRLRDQARLLTAYLRELPPNRRPGSGGMSALPGAQSQR